MKEKVYKRNKKAKLLMTPIFGLAIFRLIKSVIILVDPEIFYVRVKRPRKSFQRF
jgi:hypothetical protein